MTKPQINTKTRQSLATYTVYSDGVEIPATISISTISVQNDINKIPSACLVLVDRTNPAGNFDLSEGNLFVPGKELEIRVGINKDEKSIFKGIIIRHGLEVSEKASKLTIDLKDPCVKMSTERKNKYYFERKDSEIIEELVSRYAGLQLKIESTPISHPEVVQYSATDWDFLVTRSEINGKICTVENGILKIQTPATNARPKLNLQFGSNVVQFRLEIDGMTQYSSGKSQSWDYTNQKIAEANARDPEMDFQGNLSGAQLANLIGLDNFHLRNGGQLGEQELQALADVKLMRSRLAKIQGQVSILGNASIQPGDVVALAGFGDRFNGKAFISSVSHEISPNNHWHTRLGLGLDSRYSSGLNEDLQDVPSVGLLAGIQGLHIGKVTELEDPNGENRVKITIPIIDVNSEGTWARMASPDAGKGRGIFFLPEVGDEVIVGFINQNPRDAIILGKLYSSANQGPLSQSNDNFQKGIVTKTGLKLIFDDDKKSISLETPNGNKITLDDTGSTIHMEDENGNKATLSSSGITLESAKDILLKASGDVQIEGLNIEIKASALLKSTGAAGAEFSSSGGTVVKGSLVQIN